MTGLHLLHLVLELAIAHGRHGQHKLDLHIAALGAKFGLQLLDLLQVVQAEQTTVGHQHHTLEWPALEQAAD
ncbi:MAG: hypothetical protein ACK53Y_21060, partial [bacterium]